MDNTKKCTVKTIYKVYQNFGRGAEFMQSFTSKKKAISFCRYVCDSYVDSFIKQNRGVDFDICNAVTEHSNPFSYTLTFGLRPLNSRNCIFYLILTTD